MIDRNSPVFKKLVDYVIWPAIALLIVGYCTLIFVSRPFLGTVFTSVLLGLGVIALALWIKLAIHAAKLRKVGR